MPPTLIASIYGMNFRHMPEFERYYGCPPALIVAIGPIAPFWQCAMRQG